MQLPKFEHDGSFGLIVRPEPVLYTQRNKPPKTGLFTILFGVFNMKKIALSFAALVSFLFAMSANAALDTTVTTAMADGLTDTKALGALGLIIVIAVAVFRKMKSAA